MGMWRRAFAIVLAVLCALGVAYAAPAQDTYLQLHTDVGLLLTVRKMHLTPAQIAGALAQAQAIAAERDRLAALRQQVWEDAGDSINAVNQAWLEGKRTPTRDKRAADNAIEKVQRAERGLQKLIEDSVATLRAGLSDEQEPVVETSKQAQARRERQARMGGASSVGEFVAGKLDQVRDLMADEYRMVGGSEALATARAILGADAPGVNDLASKVLEMMNQARTWTPQQYSSDRKQLPQMVEQFLGIEEPDLAKFVTYDDLTGLLADERAVVVLGALAQPAEGGGGQ
ncbi:MAG TPA: hypothetical protein VM283_04935 [Armatimonadota bacterium]|nr:hypothetical protein [Armatimonadota bacterium]